jgi:hypothetical protein
MHTLSINNSGKNHTINKVSQEFVNGFIYAMWKAKESKCKLLTITTDAKIPQESDFSSYGTRVRYSFSIPGSSDLQLLESNEHEVFIYNQYWSIYLANSSFQPTCKYTALIIGQYLVQLNSIFQFDSLDFVEGYYAFASWFRSYQNQFIDNSTYIPLDITISIGWIHYQNKLCHIYINHNLKPDITPIANVIRDYLIDDVLNIIAEYASEMCTYYHKYTSYTYGGRYTHCETLCELYTNICRVCKKECNTFPRTSVRLEVALDA